MVKNTVVHRGFPSVGHILVPPRPSSPAVPRVPPRPRGPRLPRPPHCKRPSPPVVVGFISAGLPKRKWDRFFPVLTPEAAYFNRKKCKLMHDRWCGRTRGTYRGGRLPVHATSPLDPSWVGFADDECELLKAAYDGRSYYGAPAYTCGRCKTSFWYEERVKSASAVTEKLVVYNNCCKAGKVFVKPFRHPPEFLRELMDFQGSARCSHFIERIHQYNCLFAFTSMGATIYRYVNDGRGPNVFKISGVVCHRVGSLLPRIGDTPKYAELYIYDGGDC